jgi:hypothetical protein
MPVQSNEPFEGSPEYFASLIVAILRRFKQSGITLTVGDLRETAPLGMNIEVVGRGDALKIEIVSHDNYIEEHVGLDYSSLPYCDPKKMN